MLASMSSDHPAEQQSRRGPGCARCSVPIYPDDRFCWNCGAAAYHRTIQSEDRGDRPVDRRVHITDWISLALLTAGSFGSGSVAAVLWQSRAGQPLPRPVNSPLLAGAVVAGVTLGVGVAYLIFITIRHRD
jgi:hypothetical protein